MKTVARFVAALALTIALGLNVAATVDLFAPHATLGYRLTYTNGFEVAAVDGDTPAAAARLAPGDHLDFTRSSLHDRIVGLGYQPVRPGERVSFVLVHRDRQRPVTLTAGEITPSESRAALFSPLASVLRLTGFAYIAVALVILLRRPNRMTLGLFLYLLSATDVTVYRLPDQVFPFAQIALDLLDVAGLVGLIVFSARFPDDRVSGWQVWLDRLALPIGALFAIPNIAWDARSLFAGESPAAWMSYGATLAALSLIVVAGATLIANYVQAPRGQHQRFAWVIVGVLFTLLSSVSGWAQYWSAAYSVAASDALLWIATILYAGAPFAIAYAVVRQRVFDISFVVSRTLVYTIVTLTIFGTFAFVEWLAGRLVEHRGGAVIFGALTAVAIAYSSHALYARVEQFVERTLFRRRHQAERRIAEVTAGMPFSESAPAVRAALLDEPLRAYALNSAKLFVRDDSGEYLDDGTPLDARIPLQVAGLRHSLRLHEGDMALAVPIFVRSQLYGVALYGAHRNGEDIDPDEAASIEALGAAAGIAYDHIEAARCEHEAERWRRLAEHQARELAALRTHNGRSDSK